jgi:hypothetical protein
MRRKYVEILMSIGAVGVILLVLISFDGRVRQEFTDHFQSGPTAGVMTAGQRVRHVVVVAAVVVREQGKAHKQIAMMLAAAGVLVLFMVKTL